MRGHRSAAVVVVGLLLLGVTPVAAAADNPQPTPTPTPTASPAPQVSLRTSRDVVDFGDSVRLRGRIKPATEGAEVEIAERDGTPIGQATTNAEGRYELSFTPERNVRMVATWTTATSDPKRVKVRPEVRVRLGRTRLFGRAVVSGRVRPALPGHRVKLTLRRNGGTYRTRGVTPEGGGRFRVRMSVGKPGSYRAVARYGRPSLVRGRDRSQSRRTALPSLAPGSRGSAVRRLEKRLRTLGYYLPQANRSYDAKTSDAVIAFNKVQRRERVGTVNEATWRALASPIRPRPRVRSDFHIEIDQTRQVIFVVKKGAVQWIVHTSTGRNGATHDGVYHVHRKIAGYSGGRLYYPSYFDGLRAIHGWEEVPTYPASHGCARIPMWSAQWMHGLAEMGTEVRVYH